VGAQVGQDPSTVLHDAALRVLGDETNVGLEREGEPQADRVAIDGRDHRLPDVPCMHVERIRAKRARLRWAERVAAAGEIGSGAEGPTGSCEDHGADVVALVALTICGLELSAHARAEGVEHLRAVECDHRDPVDDIEPNLRSVHAGRLTGRVLNAHAVRLRTRSATAPHFSSTDGSRAYCTIAV